MTPETFFLMLDMLEELNSEIYSSLVDEDPSRLCCYSFGIMMVGVTIFIVKISFFN